MCMMPDPSQGLSRQIAVLSRVWLGTHGTWLDDLLLGSRDVETATTSFIQDDEACYLECATVL